MTNASRFGCVIGLLLLTAADLRCLPRTRLSPAADLAVLPTQFADWSGRDLPDMTTKEKHALAADSQVLREYRRAGESPVVLFVAYYRSQQSGDAIHSPKNCLPGAGWAPVSSEVVRVRVQGADRSAFSANHYVIEKDGVKQDVLYWYQGHGRRFASEYLGKFYLAWDAASEGRTDGALVRITALREGEGGGNLVRILGFAESLTPVLSRVLPS